MDILELKSAWTLLQREIISQDRVDESKIQQSVHGQSKSEISSIKNNLYLKFIIASLSIGVAIGLAVTSYLKPSFNPLDFIFSVTESVLLYSLMAVSISVMVYFNYQAFRQIKIMQHTSFNLKENLENFIQAMQKAISFNILSDACMTPIVFAWLYYAYAFQDRALGLDGRTLCLFVLPVWIGFLSFYFQRYVQRLKFGQYVDRLISYLDSLQK